MNFNEICVLCVLAVCCFVANVLHGLTGCGSILVLHALWQTAVTFAPDVLHSTRAFGDENVKSIAEFSYVLAFFIQIVLTGLLFFDERRKHARELEQGVPPTPSGLNSVLLIVFILSSFIGAAVGVFTMPSIYENGSRIIFGGSSLFFALTFLSLYQMKYLERKKMEDVIRDDLTLMRIQSEVQRHMILQYMENQKRRKQRKERRRRHRAQRRQAKKAEKMHRRELLLNVLMASNKNSNDNNDNGASSPASAASSGADSSQRVLVPPNQRKYDGTMLISELEGVPLEPNLAHHNPLNPSNPLSASPSDPLIRSCTSRPLEVHGAPHVTSASLAYVNSEVHLPKSLAGEGEDWPSHHPNSSGHRRHYLQRFWIKEVDVRKYIYQRLREISRGVDSAHEEVSREAQLAASTLRAIEGHESDPPVLSPHAASPVEGRRYSSSHGSSDGCSVAGGDTCDTEGDDTTATSTSLTPSTTRYTLSKTESKLSGVETDSESAGVREHPPTRTFCVDSNADAAAEREELHKQWKTLLGEKKDKEDGAESIDLSKSIAMAAATVPRRIIMGHAEVFNIGLREAQQQQLKTLRELNSNIYKRDHYQYRLVNFMRMDGGVVTSAIVSSFFSGLLGSYTGVADPPLMIFALAMNISVPELRINYAVSSIVPAALRAVVGIVDGFAVKSLFVYYFVSVLFAWGGMAVGLHIGHRNAVTHSTFMISTLATLLLVAFLMLAPIHKAFIRLVATAACFIVVVLAIFRQQKKPEHRRPPAPPNTPATATEVEAFEEYWRQHSRHQRVFLGSQNSGSLPLTGCLSASVSPTQEVPPPPHKLAQVRNNVLQSEGLPVRLRQHSAEEELLVIVPVNAASKL